MKSLVKLPRRILIRAGGLVVAAALAAPAIVPRLSLAASQAGGEEVQGKGADMAKEGVTPPEDLMREHGVLDRILLVYEAAVKRIVANEDLNPAIVTESAEIIRDFINNYHERSEEEHVFPRFKQAGQMTGLVDVLLQQHEAGRRVTAEILRLAPASRRGSDERPLLVGAIGSFINMYRPHAAREDTELFPRLKDLVSDHEYDSMAEEFEKKEHELFGEDGFDKMVHRVAALEQKIGINDLSQFTPRALGTEGRSGK
jgi:hemerythrin-like domain-containing protein